MMVGKYHGSVKDLLLFVIEPGNIQRLMENHPLVKPLRQFVPELPGDVDIAIVYTPDIMWVEEQVRAGRDLTEVLSASATRSPVFRDAPDDVESDSLPMKGQGPADA